MKKIARITFLILLIAGCRKEMDNAIKNATSGKEVQTAVFEKVAAAESGIHFENKIVHDVATRENLFDYDYFYNGAGVGIEDLNNDGLPDLFFCGNQVENRLFINSGNLQFNDVTPTANINDGKGWSTGVTFVDINGDGWMDIYISQGGPGERENRKNLLFINQKDMSFKEQAEFYGLADTGIGTQAAFFDMDKDGDLDCIVMNENEFYGIDPINLYRLVNQNDQNKYYNSSHLYRNDNGKFVDVSRAAGIERPIFGLGLSVSDINNDGWLDMYIASDYYIPDALFINNGNGTFSDRIKDYTNHTSYYGMGIDIADINNDGLQDIFILDMASSDHVRSKTLMASMSTGRFDYLVNKANFQYQYMYNSLQLNLGNNRYSDIAQLSETANTDWSWSVILSDFDNDEDKDIYITNGYRRYALDNDLQGKVFEARTTYGNKVPLEVKNSLYEAMPSEKLPNILYQNRDRLTFENTAAAWGLGDLSFSNGAASADLDNDGDLDMVVNNMDENAFLYRNTTSEKARGNFLKVKALGQTSEPFAKINIRYQGKSQFIETKRVRGYMSAMDNTAHFGLGEVTLIDTVKVTWLSGKTEEKYKVPANSTLSFNEKDGTLHAERKDAGTPYFSGVNPNELRLDFTHMENPYDDFDKEILLPYKQSNFGPYIAKGDVNGDGRPDLHIGGASGQAGKIYLGTPNGYSTMASKVLEEDRAYEDMEAAFFDFDGDTDLDLYVVSGGNEFEEHSSLYADRIYINNGSGVFSRFNSPVLQSYPKSGKSVTVIDYDKDGDMDILVGNRMIPKNYPKPSTSVLYENLGGTLKDVTAAIAPDLLSFGIINSVLATDFNNDGWEDFIAVGEWTSLGFFENKKGIFAPITTGTDTLQERGWWFSIRETDVNKDGLKDYLVGNIGLNIKFKASKEKPFKIFATDFDDNGTTDIVLSKKYHGTYVPVRGRECSSQQMPFIKDKFPTYSEFANATLSDIYGDKLSASYENEITELRSVLLLNKGNGSFEKKILPVEAQIFPVMDAVFMDLNADGFEDVILGGNLYETEVETPRLDAVSGLVLLSNGKDGYNSMPSSYTGLYLEGNVKDLDMVRLSGEYYLINTTNNGPLGAHKWSSKALK
ncbi:MAG TPA: VCBS repeat-containing protein [Eudoraea sp.]|nr:VCBS repeat-containing protein [Eudoraea sp.]